MAPTAPAPIEVRSTAMEKRGRLMFSLMVDRVDARRYRMMAAAFLLESAA
jgi:hypothetical protein